MAKLVYTEQELMSHHDYARPHVVDGQHLHGGFDADGKYISPRTRIRTSAVEAWAEALRRAGGELLAVDPAIRDPQRYPNAAQMKLLLREGVDRVLWDSFTITGLLEARGRLLAEAQFPRLQEVVLEDITEMGIGHLGIGMLKAHGLDEGGEPEKGIGAHNVMWLIVRDLAFGHRDYPKPVVPEVLGRPDGDHQLAPELPPAYERLIMLMMNLLLIEYAAESLFTFNQSLLGDPELFTPRRAGAQHAAQIVDRIRQDETLHVTSLRVDLGELRAITFKTVDGGTVSGARVIDRLWAEVVRFARNEQPTLRHEQQRRGLERVILDHSAGRRILAEFDSLRS